MAGRINFMNELMRKSSSVSLVFFILLAVSMSGAQIPSRGTTHGPTAEPTDNYFTKPTQLIDLPTASILRGGDLRGSIRLYEEGGVLGRLSVGISRRIMFGVSYGGENLIGMGDVAWNKVPGVHFAYRLIEEDLTMPAIVLGFDSQGYGKYWRKEDYSVAVRADSVIKDRYSVKSRGFYVVGSKGYQSLWKVGLHAGISYSMERADKDSDPTIFLGMDVQLSGDLAVIGEYDFAANDDKLRSTNYGRGYLNAGFRWAFTSFMFLEFDIKNILSEKNGDSNVVRILRIGYYSSILRQ